MPYVPSKKTDGKSTDRELIDVAVEKFSQYLNTKIFNNFDLLKIYTRSFLEVAFLANNNIKNNKAQEGIFIRTILEVGEKYKYDGAFLGELNYGITRVIQRVPQILANQEKCGLVKGKELRYWLYAMTTASLLSVATKLTTVDKTGVSGVFIDIKDEYKVRVNKSYEIAQILKSGDCYDTPYFNKVVEIRNNKNEVIGHTYIELQNDGNNVNVDKMPFYFTVNEDN